MAEYFSCAFVLLILAAFAIWPTNCENMNSAAQHAHVRSLPDSGIQCQACSSEVSLTQSTDANNIICTTAFFSHACSYEEFGLTVYSVSPNVDKK